MDVRCESCHTEYELDDGNVKDTGTEVQCTSCGHTFTVYPTGVTPGETAAGANAAAPGARPSLAAAEFLLETADGRTHRLRELTMLQKWIIERKVTRADRISRHGQPWARLGTLEDLAPFFDVVDEADRARAAVGRGFAGDGSAAGAGSRTAPPPGSAGSGSPGPASLGSPFGALHAPAGSALAGQAQTPGRTGSSMGPGSSPRGSTPESQRAVNRSLELLAVEAPALADEPDTSIVLRPAGRAWWKLLVTFGVAGGVFYFGIRALPSLMVKGRGFGAAGPAPATAPIGSPAQEAAVPPVAPGAATPPGAAAPAEIPGAPPANPAATAAPPGGVAPAGTPEGTPAATAEIPAPEPTHPQPIAEAVVPAAIPTPAPAAAAPAAAPGAAETPPPARSAGGKNGPRARARAAAAAATVPGDDLPYDRLVAQADRLLENGGNDRALRLYERALTVRPDGPEALTGIGYVHLDRNRTGAAIEFFTRASSVSPFAPALFGLGQAYRAAGDPGRARQTYQRYLALYPTGSDAAAAERQLQSLAPAGGTGEAPASILHEGGSEPARPATAPESGK